MQGRHVVVAKPSPDALRRFLATQVNRPLTYEAVGATAETPPASHVVDRTRIKLGQGEAVFRSAIAALRRWEQFDLAWVEAWPWDTPIQKGEVVAVMAGPSEYGGSTPAGSCTSWTRWGRVEIRVRLRHATRPHRERRAAIPDRVGPVRRRGVVRHPGVLPSAPVPGRSSAACRSGSGGTRRRPCSRLSGPLAELRNELLGWLQAVVFSRCRSRGPGSRQREPSEYPRHFLNRLVNSYTSRRCRLEADQDRRLELGRFGTMMSVISADRV
jgi:hypothetical protein